MYDPVLFLAMAADGIATIVLFLFFQEFRDIRGRILPLGILTLVHTILIPLYMIADANSFAISPAPDVAVLGVLYLFSPLFLLPFGIIYPIALSEHSRMPRPLGISCFVFSANIILQGVLVLVLAVLVSAYD